MQMFAIVMAKSLDALALLSFFLILVIMLFGALIYFCEAGLDNWSHELGGFASRCHWGQLRAEPVHSLSFWWVLVTATTVGYGDMAPTSFERCVDNDGWCFGIGIASVSKVLCRYIRQKAETDFASRATHACANVERPNRG